MTNVIYLGIYLYYKYWWNRINCEYLFWNYHPPHDDLSCSFPATLNTALCDISWLMSKWIFAAAATPPPTAFILLSGHSTPWLMLYSEPVQCLQTPIYCPSVLIRGHTYSLVFLALFPIWYKDPWINFQPWGSEFLGSGQDKGFADRKRLIQLSQQDWFSQEYDTFWLITYFVLAIDKLNDKLS